MNCKQGDLAMFIVSTAGNEGKIVRCVEFLGSRLLLRKDGSVYESPCWRTEPPLMTWCGNLSDITSDHQLRPIRDNDGQDETLTWAELPKKKEVKS